VGKPELRTSIARILFLQTFEWGGQAQKDEDDAHQLPQAPATPGDWCCGLASSASWTSAITTPIPTTLALSSLTGPWWGMGLPRGHPRPYLGRCGGVDCRAAGGLGFLLGDGRLNYDPERILEAGCAMALGPHFPASLDLQRCWNPGYNAERGPVTLICGSPTISGRLARQVPFNTVSVIFY